MQLSHLSLAHFRNYEELEISFGEAHQLFLGQNGEGKTNLLEAIHLLGVGSSMRGARDASMVREGAAGYRVGGRFLDRAHTDRPALRAEVLYDLPRERGPGTKRILLDKVAARASDLLAAIKVVAFAPADQELVQGSGSLRRRYLDGTGCQLSSEYLQLLREYQRALKQRNETLSRSFLYENGRAASYRSREPWTDLLVDVGAQLTNRRAELVQRIHASVGTLSREAYRGAGPLEITYEPGIPGEPPDAGEFRAALERAQGREEAIGYTTVGPHVDDLRLELGGRDLRRFGSLGQQQLSAMFLKLAQAELVRTVAGASPILLVDEMFAILDRQAAEQFLERVESGGQIFLATAQEGWLTELRHRQFRVHRVQRGTIATE